MADIATIATALKTAITTYTTQTRVITYMPDMLPGSPCIVITPDFDRPVDMNVTQDGSNGWWHFRVLAFVDKQNIEGAWRVLNLLMSSSGADSIYAALMTDNTQGGVVRCTLVGSVEQAGRVTIGETDYLSCSWAVDIQA